MYGLIDLNMVLAGVVTCPENWYWSGYHEIQKPPQRYAVIDTKALLELFGINHFGQYQRTHKGWIEDALKAEDNQRMYAWTQNLAVGSQDYVTSIKSALGLAGNHRTVTIEGDVHTLKEPVTSYMVHLGDEKQALSDDNAIELE